ncbi:hypothetical protein BLNAU_6961 [Blattamonas nauphoetae]|uniref:Uncharacterized protein n=1 Tax=Blattamonas nauphoetae TaxID=2049346 RepID=A0ABQ9Y2R6_9EUKA|nr:hypothetical protein BLNAU_6961 [Blattamonas nauphoetae]
MQSYLTFIALECKEEQHRAIQRVFNRTAILLFSLCATFEWFIQFYHRVPFVFSLMRDMTTLEAEGYLFEHIHQLSTNLETWTRIDPIVFQTGRRVFLGVIQEGWEDFAEQQLLMASGGYRTAREGTVGKTVRDIWKIFGGNLS